MNSLLGRVRDGLVESTTFRVVCTNVDSNLIADQHNFRAKYLQNGEEN